MVASLVVFPRVSLLSRKNWPSILRTSWLTNSTILLATGEAGIGRVEKGRKGREIEEMGKKVKAGQGKTKM